MKLTCCVLCLTALLGCSIHVMASDMAHGTVSTKAPTDKQSSWDNARTRPATAITTAFDHNKILWQARVVNGHILLSQSTDHGKTFRSPTVVNTQAETISAAGENRPKIAFAKNNTIYISWTRSLDQPYSGDIRFAYSTDGGKHFSQAVTVNDNHDIISHRFDALSVDTQGNIHLVWLDKRDQLQAKKTGKTYTGNAVYHAVSRDQGRSFSANQKLADNSCECCRIAMDIDQTGTPVIFWRHIYGRNVRDHALLKLDGKSQPVRVSYDHWEIAACPHHGGAISIDENNNTHLTWFNNGPERHGLFYARSTDEGKTFSTALNFGNYDAQAAHPFVLAVKQSVHLVWKEFDGKQTQIQAMQSVDQGNTWLAVKIIATTDDASDHPLLVSDGNNAWLSWNTAKQGFVFKVMPTP